MGSNKRHRASIIAAIAAAGALVLTACGGSSTVPTQTAAGSTSGAFPTSGSGEVHVYNWTDYIDPEQLKAFTAETGIKVVLDTFDSNETMLAKLQSGATGYDIVVPSDYMVAQMIELNLLQKVDVASFPNGKNLKPAMLDVYWDKGRQYTAPWMYGSTGIVCVTTDPECNKITSWKDYFSSTSKTMDSLKDQVEVVGSALRAAGVASADLCTTDKTKYQAAADILANFHPAIIDSDNGIDRVINGTSTIRNEWNGGAHRVKVKVPTAKYIYPSEGLNFWADNLAIPVGAPNLDNAKIFINWMMDPKNAAAESNFTGYDNGIQGSDAFMDDALKTDPAVIPSAEDAAKLSPTPNCPQEARDLYSKVFQDWLSHQG